MRNFKLVALFTLLFILGCNDTTAPPEPVLVPLPPGCGMDALGRLWCY
jgi:hypothetical protein